MILDGKRKKVVANINIFCKSDACKKTVDLSGGAVVIINCSQAPTCDRTQIKPLRIKCWRRNDFKACELTRLMVSSSGCVQMISRAGSLTVMRCCGYENRLVGLLAPKSAALAR